MLYYFFNDTATPDVYTLSLHDALPISFPLWATGHVVLPRPASFTLEACGVTLRAAGYPVWIDPKPQGEDFWAQVDRKSTRLNSSHITISYAVFCLKKKSTVL